ncbi:MAG: energy transducer TonB [Acidobacteriia bacterium]|nr:energy transducer TonB [Terriglobia bacterium]
MSSLNTNIAPMFAGLPSGPKRRNAFAISFVLQALGVVVLVQLGLIQPAAIIQKHQYVWVSLAPPPPVNHEPQKVPPKLLAAAKARVERAEVAKLEPPKIEVPARKPDIPEVKPEVVKPGSTFPTVAAERPSPRPAPQVKAGVFSTGSSATPTTLLPASKVQTGGFGDPNGVPAGHNTSGRVNIAALGSFDLPQGSGYGNGTGGSRGARGVVISTGFGNGVATGNGSLGARSTATVKPAGFAAVEPVKQTAHRVEEPKADIAPVQILSKPTPGYTAEARAARVEGEVLLEVVFTASGKLHVIRVVRSLGHGLDESAIRAAEQIRYKPATRGGSPVDSTATLHILFQMA